MCVMCVRVCICELGVQLLPPFFVARGCLRFELRSVLRQLVSASPTASRTSHEGGRGWPARPRVPLCAGSRAGETTLQGPLTVPKNPRWGTGLGP